MSHARSLIIALLALSLGAAQARSQDAPPSPDPADVPGPAGAVKVFMATSRDDLDYYKTQLGFVDFVRDRADAEVQIVVSQVRTSSGGALYTLEFRGQGRFASLADTLECSVGPGATEDEKRKVQLKTMKFGLMRFVARTPQAGGVSISYAAPGEAAAKVDKWNHWVYSLSANGWFQGQKGWHQTQVYSTLSASRITARDKASLSGWSEYNGVTWDNGEGESTSVSRGRGISGYLVFGLSDHWSTRAAASAWNSSYSNIESAVTGSGSLEYSIFPYDQSTRRQLRLIYRLETEYDDYEERTIFDKSTEWTAAERLTVYLKLVEPWGSVTNTLGFSNYLHSFPLNRLDWNTNVSLSLVKGVKLTANGYVALVHDQLALRADSAAESDVLLRRREMATSYEYFLSLGVELSFGSIYSNEVNARFGS